MCHDFARSTNHSPGLNRCSATRASRAGHTGGLEPFIEARKPSKALDRNVFRKSLCRAAVPALRDGSPIQDACKCMLYGILRLDWIFF